jgi:nitrilase
MAVRNDEPFKVAVAQASPVFLDREATVEKACGLIAQAGKEGARLVVFPETFIPAYPDWVWSVPPGEKGLLDPLYAELMENAVVVPGPDTARLCQAARAAGIYVAMGINEYDPLSGSGTLYNTVVYIDAQGEVLGRHRKLVPTGGERLVWAQGDGSTLEVYQTPFGKLGGLICWENYMPLARYAMYAWGVQIYTAATWDYGEAWLATLRHIAREGRVFVLAACMPMRKSDIPDHYAFKRFYQSSDEWINPGGSAIVNPDGEIVAGPLEKAEGLLYAEIRPAQLYGPKRMMDVTGHYNRPDVFQLTVNRAARPILRETDDAGN